MCVGAAFGRKINGQAGPCGGKHLIRDCPNKEREVSKDSNDKKVTLVRYTGDTDGSAEDDHNTLLQMASYYEQHDVETEPMAEDQGEEYDDGSSELARAQEQQDEYEAEEEYDPTVLMVRHGTSAEDQEDLLECKPVLVSDQPDVDVAVSTERARIQKFLRDSGVQAEIPEVSSNVAQTPTPEFFGGMDVYLNLALVLFVLLSTAHMLGWWSVSDVVFLFSSWFVDSDEVYPGMAFQSHTRMKNMTR